MATQSPQTPPTTPFKRICAGAAWISCIAGFGVFVVSPPFGCALILLAGICALLAMPAI